MGRKLLIFLLVFVLVIGLTGCGSKDNTTDETEQTNNNEITDKTNNDDTQEQNDYYELFINTSGMGQVAYAQEGEEHTDLIAVFEME